MSKEQFMKQTSQCYQQQLKFYLLGLVSSSCSLQNIGRDQLCKKVYFQFLESTSKIKEIKGMLKQLHAELQMNIFRVFPEAKSDEISMLGKKQLKRYIRQNIEEMINSYTIEAHCQENNIVNKQSSYIIIQDSELVKIEENQEGKIKRHKQEFIIEQKRDDDHQFSFESANALMSSYDDDREDSEQFGHFLYGDKAEAITGIQGIHQQLFATISWKQRQNGSVPKDSQLSVEQVRRFDPCLMIEALCQFLSNNQTKIQVNEEFDKSGEYLQEWDESEKNSKKDRWSKKIQKKNTSYQYINSGYRNL